MQENVSQNSFLIVLLQGVLLFYIYDGTSQILDISRLL